MGPVYSVLAQYLPYPITFLPINHLTLKDGKIGHGTKDAGIAL